MLNYNILTYSIKVDRFVPGAIYVMTYQSRWNPKHLQFKAFMVLIEYNSIASYVYIYTIINMYIRIGTRTVTPIGAILNLISE